MLARKITRTSYFWLTMETNCCQFVQRYRVSNAWRSHTRSTIRVACIDLTLAVFSLGHRYFWEDFVKVSSGHEFILVAIDYFTKWVEATSYAKLNVATFTRSHIIYRYGVPHELISDRGVHFRDKVDTLLQRYGIQHHRSFAYRS